MESWITSQRQWRVGLYEGEATVGLEGKWGGRVGLSVGCGGEGGFSTVNSSALASPRLGVLDEPLQGDV